MRTLSAFWRRQFVLAISCVLFLTCVPEFVSSASANTKYSGIVVDAKTGKTLYSYKADKLRYPASLTKMMTMYMMFEALHNGKIKKSTRIRISKNAAAEVPSKLGIRAGRSITANNAILALATKSANDVATAVAEHLGGSERNFALMMTKRARSLGMKNTTFKNAHGLTAKGQLTTARDMSRLGIALREHYPQYYGYFQTRSFKYGKARYRNHNRLLGTVRGVDGIKTGYTRASGFNLVSSVQDRKRSIVGVVLGGRSGKSRNAQMSSLIRQYLPKASRRSKKQLIASRRTINPIVVASANIRLPKRGPVPNFRPRVLAATSGPVVMAAAAPTQPVRAFASTKSSQQQVSIQERLFQGGNGPVPSVSPVKAYKRIDPVQVASIAAVSHKNQARVVQTNVAKSATPKGWVIQVGATDSADAAYKLLNNVRSKAPSALGSKEIYTETVVKGSSTLHRARFYGFLNKNEARKACRALKAKRVACLALSA